MADVFISWGSPDRAAVVALCLRLRELGIEYFEYTDDMVAGDNIPDRIWEEIHQAKAVVVCLSEATVARPWVQTEVAWSFRGGTPLKPVLPVKVGSFPDNMAPPLLRSGNLYIYTVDLSKPGGSDEGLLKLAEDILTQLGSGAPQVVPAALFAMTQEQCEALFQSWRTGQLRTPAIEALWLLCQTVGMAGPPALFDLLSQRYGERPEDLAPFQGGRPLIGLLDETLQMVNRIRVLQKRRPIFLRWIQDELSSGSSQAIRDLWRSGDSLLVIDSISTLCNEVSLRITDLPKSRERTRSALLWIPPYTQLTARLEDTLGTAVRAIGTLGDDFSDLDYDVNRPVTNYDIKRPVTFDVGTSLALRLWLLRSLDGFPDDSPPLQEPVEEMRPKGKLRPRRFHPWAA